MGKPFLYEVRDLVGGLNESAPEQIGDNEFTQSDNFYTDGNSLWQRPGYAFVAGTYSEDILSMALYDPDPTISNDELVILGCRSSLAKIVGATIVPLTVADGRVYPSSDNRWWFEQYNDEMFACQRGNGGVKRIFGSAVMEAGIAPPTTGPVIRDGGPGRKEGGVYRMAVRYYNRQTGAKSNWSPLSNEITLSPDRKLHADSVPISSNPQVNARQIGATPPDDSVIYLVGQIDDNVSTTFDDNARFADNEYGEADSTPSGVPITDTRHGLPPSQAWAIAKHKERLFVLNKEGLFWSEVADFQSFKPTSFIPVVRGTGLISWEEHGLVILTEQNTPILLGDTPSDWRMGMLSLNHPCPSGKSAAIGDGTLFWYTGTNIVASSGGAPQILPGIEKVRSTLNSIADADKDDVVGVTIPNRGWYVLTTETPDGRKGIIFDYRLGRFVGAIPDAPKTLERLLRESATAEKVYASFEGDFDVVDYLTGTSDAGAAITATLKTKKFGYDSQGTQKLVRRVGVLCPATNGTIRLRVYHDDVLVITRAALSLARAGWKRFTLNTSGNPGTLVQIELQYAGTPQLRLDELQIEGILLPGRRAISQ